MNDKNKKKQVLLVDDDPDILEQLSVMLQGDTYEVMTAQGQADAEEAILRGRPDIAIIDLMMENMDSGFVLSHYLKKIYPDTPVILLTAVTSATGISFDTHDTTEKSWVKVDKVMDKPVRAEQLKAEIRRLLKEENVAMEHKAH